MSPPEPFRWGTAEQAAVNQLRNKVTFDGQFFRVRLGRWLVKTDVSSRLTAEVAAFYHAFEKMFTDAVPGAKLDNQSVTVVVFANKLDYVAVPNHPETSGTTHFGIDGIGIYTYIPPKTGSRLADLDIGTLIHEGVHALLFVHFGHRHTPVWVHEGMACYFEPWSPHRSRESNIAGRMARSPRMHALATAWTNGDRNIPSLAELIDFESGTWSAALGKDSGSYNYAMAEAWMAYLLSTLDGAAAFVDYFRDLSLAERIPPFRLGDHPAKFERYFWTKMSGSSKAPRPLRSPPAKPATIRSTKPDSSSILDSADAYDEVIVEMTVSEANKRIRQAQELLEKRQYITAELVVCTAVGVVQANRRYLGVEQAEQLIRQAEALRAEIHVRRKLAAYRIPETTGEFRRRLRSAESLLTDGKLDAAEQAVVEAKIFVENRSDSLDDATRTRLYQSAEDVRTRISAARRARETTRGETPHAETTLSDPARKPSPTGRTGDGILLLINDWAHFTSARTENADTIQLLQPRLLGWLRQDAAGWAGLETYIIVGQGRGNWPAGRADSAICRDDAGAKTFEDRHADPVDLLPSRVDDLVRMVQSKNPGVPLQVVVFTPYQAHKREVSAPHSATTAVSTTWVVLAGPEARDAKLQRQYPGATLLRVSDGELSWGGHTCGVDSLRELLRNKLIAAKSSR